MQKRPDAYYKNAALQSACKLLDVVRLRKLSEGLDAEAHAFSESKSCENYPRLRDVGRRYSCTFGKSCQCNLLGPTHSESADKTG